MIGWIVSARDPAKEVVAAAAGTRRRRRGRLLAVALLLSLAGLAAPANRAVAAEGASLQARVLLVPRQETVLSAQMAGRIALLDVTDGDRVKRDQPLVVFDCTLQEAQLRKATARLEGARKTQAANRRLNDLKANSALEAELAAAAAGEAAAELAMIEATVRLCMVQSPYDGRISVRRANPHQSVTVGQPLLELYDDRTLEARLVVPSRWLAWLRPGMRFTMEIDETGLRYPAVVSRIGGRIDPASQSITVAGTIENASGDLLAGMSGTALFTPP